MRRLLLAALLSGGAAAAHAAERVALVIGNEAYLNAAPVAGAAAEAEAAAERLTRAGFEVTLGVDLDAEAMAETLEAFAESAAQAEAAMVVYAGRAAALGGATWLLPVDLAAETPLELARAATPLAAALGVAAPEGAALALIDAAAPGGWSDLPGAAPGVAAAAETGPLLLAAAQPSEAAAERGGDYLEAALDALLAEDERVVDAVEALSDARETAYVGGAAPAELTLAPAAASDIDRELELELWRAAERSGRAEDYRAYLARFPNGVFAGIARNRVDAAAPAAAAAPEADPAEAGENALSLDRDERRAIQRELNALGYDTRGVDGIFGPGTRSAVEGWQRAQGREATGFLDAEGARALLSASEARAAEERRRAEAEARETEAALNLSRADRIAAQEALQARGLHTGGAAGVFGPETRDAVAAFQARRGDPQTGYLTGAQVAALQEPAPPSEQELWNAAVAADEAQGYQDYLDAYPAGAQAEAARARLAAMRSREAAQSGRGDAAATEEAGEAPAGDLDQATLQRVRGEAAEDALGLDQPSRAAVEQRLAQAGYAPGAPDGEFTEETRQAIAGFQGAQGLLASGYLNRETVRALVEATGGAQEITPEALIGTAVRGLLQQLNR